MALASSPLRDPNGLRAIEGTRLQGVFPLGPLVTWEPQENVAVVEEGNFAGNRPAWQETGSLRVWQFEKGLWGLDLEGLGPQ